MKLKSLLKTFLLVVFSLNISQARDYIRIVGSSTVYPFSTVIAENFSDATSYKTPLIESNGTGGGMKLFCSGVGERYPDLSNASRAIKKTEKAICKKNGIKDVVEVKIGYDGIVIANLKSNKKSLLTRKQIFLALADKIPVNGKLVKNKYKFWNEIDSSLPNKKIKIYGPPPTSGTRDAFVELVMQKPCVKMKEFKAKHPNKKTRKKACHIIRNDGVFVEAGENDNLIVQKLFGNKNAYGIFGFSFLQDNKDLIEAVTIEGYYPTFENISNGSYSVSRPLFIYLKKNHINLIPGVKEFVNEILSLDTIGEDGYLIEKGLIPMDPTEYKKIKKEVLSNF
jgi:phosphate transport system substrate-binding protein